MTLLCGMGRQDESMRAQSRSSHSGFNVIDVRVGETILLQSVDFGEISLTINAKDGQRVRLGIKASESVKVHRPARKAV